jgi:hypothetical protein
MEGAHPVRRPVPQLTFIADLHQIIRSGQSLSNSHMQYFLYQLLRGMKVSVTFPP